MNTSTKMHFSLAVLAAAAFIAAPNAARAVAGDVGLSKVLNTSPVWADTGNYHACNVVNVTTSNNVNVKIDLIDGAGNVLQNASQPIPAGTSVEVANGAANYTGFARCRVTVNNPDWIRANISVYHWTGSYFDVVGSDIAR